MYWDPILLYIGRQAYLIKYIHPFGYRIPVNTGYKLNVHKMFRRHPRRFLNWKSCVCSIYVLCLRGWNAWQLSSNESGMCWIWGNCSNFRPSNNWHFGAWYPLKGRICLKKSAAERWKLKVYLVCVIF